MCWKKAILMRTKLSLIRLKWKVPTNKYFAYHVYLFKYIQIESYNAIPCKGHRLPNNVFTGSNVLYARLPIRIISFYSETKNNTIALFGTTCNTIFWGRLPFVMLSFVYGTKYNNILAKHYCVNIAITTTNARTSAKYIIAVHDSICATKCNDNNRSYPGNSAKCVTVVFTVHFLGSYSGNGTKCVSR